MFGIISIISGGRKVAIQPLFEKAEPLFSGVQILEWVRWASKDHETIYRFAQQFQKVKIVEDFQVGKAMARTGMLDTRYLNLGPDILPAIIRGEISCLLSASQVVDENPEQCVVYELDLDQELFGTYINANQVHMPHAGWRILKLAGTPSEVFGNLHADAACFSFDSLPTAEDYQSLWVSKKQRKAAAVDQLSKNLRSMLIDPSTKKPVELWTLNELDRQCYVAEQLAVLVLEHDKDLHRLDKQLLRAIDNCLRMEMELICFNPDTGEDIDPFFLDEDTKALLHALEFASKVLCDA